jgi:hypothetical protein
MGVCTQTGSHHRECVNSLPSFPSFTLLRLLIFLISFHLALAHRFWKDDGGVVPNYPKLDRYHQMARRQLLLQGLRGVAGQQKFLRNSISAFKEAIPPTEDRSPTSNYSRILHTLKRHVIIECWKQANTLQPQVLKIVAREVLFPSSPSTSSGKRGRGKRKEKEEVGEEEEGDKPVLGINPKNEVITAFELKDNEKLAEEMSNLVAKLLGSSAPKRTSARSKKAAFDKLLQSFPEEEFVQEFLQYIESVHTTLPTR